MQRDDERDEEGRSGEGCDRKRAGHERDAVGQLHQPGGAEEAAHVGAEACRQDAVDEAAHKDGRLPIVRPTATGAPA